jgi:hypothetical protein
MKPSYYICVFFYHACILDVKRKSKARKREEQLARFPREDSVIQLEERGEEERKAAARLPHSK